jgi:hypothetical protein
LISPLIPCFPLQALRFPFALGHIVPLFLIIFINSIRLLGQYTGQAPSSQSSKEGTKADLVEIPQKLSMRFNLITFLLIFVILWVLFVLVVLEIIHIVIFVIKTYASDFFIFFLILLVLYISGIEALSAGLLDKGTCEYIGWW